MMNNTAERTLRLCAISRKNWLFVGSDPGGETAAICFSILAGAKLIFDSCAPAFDVSPLVMGRGSLRSVKHSATSRRILPLKTRFDAV